MNKLLYILIAGIIALLPGQDGLVAAEGEKNMLSDVEAIKTDKSCLYTFKLAKKPFYSLSSTENGWLAISFPDTFNQEGLGAKLESNPYIHLDNAADKAKTDFVLQTENGYGRVTCGWINEKSVFLVSIEADDETGNIKNTNTRTNIKDIRFGFKENAARMVIGTSDRPTWKIEYSEANAMALFINASSENIKTKTYSSDKWLNNASISETGDKSTAVNLNLNSAPDQTVISWISVGNRLVLDMAERPEEMLSGLPTENKTETKAAPVINLSVDNGKKEFKNIVRMKIDKKELMNNLNNNPKEHEVTQENEAVQANQVAQDKEIKKEKESAPDIAADVKPILKDTLPDSAEVNVDVDKLSPNEAFLLGRIRQAKEINDYSTGIKLSNQFLKEFPKSALREAVSFWRGDFYYEQWDKGDKSVGEKVIKAYTYAIDNFDNSPNILPSYIKMAIVSSGINNSYQALGYLSIVIGSNTPDLTPLAYLTRGKVFLQIDQTEKAMKDFKVILEQYEDTKYAMEANLWIGNYYHKVGLYKEAEEKLKEIEARYPGLFLEYPDSILLSAKNYIYLKKFKEAREYLFKAVNLGGQQESIDLLLSRIGDTYHNEENDKEAEKYYRMVVDYYPGSEGASISKLRLAEYFSDIAMLDEVGKTASDETISELALLEKAYQLFEKREYDETIKTIKPVALKPIQTETRKDAKRLYIHSVEKEIERLREAGMYNDLLFVYNENSEVVKDNINPEILVKVAEAYRKLGRNDEAVRVYGQINTHDINIDSKGNFMLGIADCYISMKDTDKAISFLEKAKKEKLQESDVQRVNMLLADMYQLKGRNKEAEDIYNQVIQNSNTLPPQDMAKAYLSLGVTFKDRKQYNEAKNALINSINIGLDNKDAQNLLRRSYIELGDILHAEGKYYQAVKAFEKGFALGYETDNHDYWEIRFKQAMDYIKIGENIKAETLLADISEGGEDTILQQRAQLKLGSIALAKQLRILSMGEN
jgi:tetratricopeptide (TPR) repeat protein